MGEKSLQHYDGWTQESICGINVTPLNGGNARESLDFPIQFHSSHIFVQVTLCLSFVYVTSCNNFILCDFLTTPLEYVVSLYPSCLQDIKDNQILIIISFRTCLNFRRFLLKIIHKTQVDGSKSK